MKIDEKIVEIITLCRRKGIELWVDGDKLKFKASEAIMNDEIKNSLRQNKQDIIAYLKQDTDFEKFESDELNRYEVFPLTDVQSAYLLGRNQSFVYGDTACQIYQEFEYERLDHVKVQNIWNELIQRHDMLRAVVHQDGYQQILEKVPEFVVPFYDVKNADSFTTIRNELSEKKYSVGEWPMFSVAISNHKKGSILHFSMEFIIADWASIWMLLKEFEFLYFEEGEKLPILDTSFRDYVLYMQKLKSTRKYQEDKKYWDDKIEEFPLSPQLPILYGKANDSVCFQRYDFVLDFNMWKQFKRNAMINNVTPTAAVLAIYAEVLAKWSINKKFCLNLTVLNRMDMEEIQNVLGDFTTIVLLEVDCQAEDSFVEKTTNINKNLFEDLDHSLYSGIEVIRELTRKKDRESSLMPYVFTSAIGLLSGKGMIGKFKGNGISKTAQVFIDCQAMDGEFGLRINWDIRIGIFPEKMIEDMFLTFCDMIRAYALDMEKWGKSIGVELPSWQVRERNVSNDTAVAFKDKLLYTSFLENVKRNPGKIAVIDSQGQYTYKELHDKAVIISKVLLQLEIGKQEKVGVHIEKGVYQLTAILGILYVGGCYVPIDINLPITRKSNIVRQARIKKILTINNNEVLNEETINIKIDSLNDIESHVQIPVHIETDQLAYTIFTSGSTGIPKGVDISHKAAMNTIEDINTKFGVNENDSIFGISELCFDLSVYDIFGILSAGGTIVYPEISNNLNPVHWKELIIRYGITIWNSVPAFMKMLLSNDELDKMKCLRLVLLSGDWIPLDMPDAIKQINREIDVVCLGGATEGGIWSIYHKYEGLKEEWKSIPYGKPLANQKFRVVYEDLSDCPVWCPGEICILGKSLAHGYNHNKQLTKKNFVLTPDTNEVMYKTGDIGRYLPGGEIEILGRKDTQVKIRGHRIELGEIESILNAETNIADSIGSVNYQKQELPINVFVLPQKTSETEADISDMFEKLVMGIDKVVEDIEKGLEKENYIEAFAARDYAAYTSLIYSLQKIGYLLPDREYSLNEIIQENNMILPTYQWVVRHWVLQLTNMGFIRRKYNGTYECDKLYTHELYTTAWNKTYELWSEKYGSYDLLNYVKENADNIPGILTGSVDPLSLLYPGGSDKYPKALYITNPMTICINRYISSFIEKVCINKKRIRILELGAGTGATTQYVLNALRKIGIEYKYTFSDITDYFFPKARKKFEGYTIEFKKLDADLSFKDQSINPNSYDIVIAAYILDNVKNIQKTLEEIERIIAPKGFLLFSEPIRIEPWVLASQAMLMTRPEDNLRQDVTFIAPQEWIELLEYISGNHIIKTFPEKGSAIYSLGAMLFIKQFKTNFMEIDEKELRERLKEKLPEYMVPDNIGVLCTFPLTSNGKVKRDGINDLFNFSSSLEVTDTENIEYTSVLDKQLLEIAKKVLKVKNIRKKQSFYDFGADSLIMAQMATETRKILSIDIPFDVLLRQMLRNPNIKELELFIDGYQENTLSKEEKEIPFYYIDNFGGDTEIRLSVMIHSSLGSADSFKYLGPELVRLGKGAALSIGANDVDKYCSIPSDKLIDYLSGYYAEIIKKMSFKKLQLIGYSFGGVLVVEIARHLMEQGIDVENISIIDGGKVPVLLEGELVNELLVLDPIDITLGDLGLEDKYVMGQIFNTMNANEQKSIAIEDIKSKLNKHDQDILNNLYAMTRDERINIYADIYSEKTGVKLDKEIIRRMILYFEHSMSSLDYDSELFFGDLDIYTCRKKEGHFQRLNFFIENWKEVCVGKVNVIDIDGDHLTSIEDEALAKDLAQKIVQRYK